MLARFAILTTDAQDLGQLREQLQRENSLFVRLIIQFQIEMRSRVSCAAPSTPTPLPNLRSVRAATGLQPKCLSGEPVEGRS